MAAWAASTLDRTSEPEEIVASSPIVTGSEPRLLGGDEPQRHRRSVEEIH